MANTDGDLVYIETRNKVAAAREAQLKEAVSQREALRAALEQIAHVEGEDDPEILWPWARQIAHSALSGLPKKAQQQ